MNSSCETSLEDEVELTRSDYHVISPVILLIISSISCINNGSLIDHDFFRDMILPAWHATLVTGRTPRLENSEYDAVIIFCY